MSTSPPPPLPGTKPPLCNHRECAFYRISDQAFSVEEAEFFLTRSEIYPLCYSCKAMLARVKAHGREKSDSGGGGGEAKAGTGA